eukprot:763193-Hanusia_phi.AAC.5
MHRDAAREMTTETFPGLCLGSIREFFNFSSAKLDSCSQTIHKDPTDNTPLNGSLKQHHALCHRQLPLPGKPRRCLGSGAPFSSSQPPPPTLLQWPVPRVFKNRSWRRQPGYLHGLILLLSPGVER